MRNTIYIYIYICIYIYIYIYIYILVHVVILVYTQSLQTYTLQALERKSKTEQGLGLQIKVLGPASLHQVLDGAGCGHPLVRSHRMLRGPGTYPRAGLGMHMILPPQEGEAEASGGVSRGAV